MKPRTKYQKQVVTSNKGLRPIKGAQMQWAFRECLDHYAFQLKHGQTTCMDCGHTWTTDEDADKCVCPKCKAKLEVQRTKRQKAMSSTYFSVLTERKGLQLMRAFQMKAYYRKGQKADIYCWEVARPGSFTIGNEKVNVLEALAMAGDMTIYGVRDNVKLIREDVNGKREIINLNLNNAEVVTSPYYYLKQNDIIYVTPNKTKAKNSDIGNSTTLWVSSLSILVSIAGLLVNILK